MKNDEEAVLGVWKPDPAEQPDNFAEGTKPRIEREQFEECLADHPIVQIMDILEDSYTAPEWKAILTFLQYYAEQPDGKIELLITKDGTVLGHVVG